MLANSSLSFYNDLMQEPKKVDLVGVGLNATDTLIMLPHYPARGSKLNYRDEAHLPGGQTASACVACQHWGLATRYIGKLGDDDAARLHHQAFAAEGVDAKIFTVPGAYSSHSTIIVDGDGERTVLGRKDDRLLLSADEIDPAWIESARVLLVDGFETQAAIRAAKIARAAGIPVVADLDEIYDGVEELISLVDYLIVSRDFPCRIMREPDLKLALRKLKERFGNKLAAATLGQDGVIAFDGNQFVYRSAFQVPVVDTTGAGDIFHAGFIYGLLQQWPLEQQLDFACAAAALNCTGSGARGGIRSVEQTVSLEHSTRRYPAAFAASESIEE